MFAAHAAIQTGAAPLLWRGFFPSAATNYLSIPSNAALAPGTGDFCIEAWVNPSRWQSGDGYYNIIAGNTSGMLQFCKEYGSSTNLTMQIYGTGTIVTSSTFPAVGSWSHVVLARQGTTISIFVNGTRTGTASSSHNINANAETWIGYCNSNSTPYNGYISNLRFVKGSSVYNPTLTALTVPAAPLTAISGTSLLTLQNSTFVDNSSSNFTITNNTSVVLSSFASFT